MAEMQDTGDELIHEVGCIFPSPLDVRLRCLDVAAKIAKRGDGAAEVIAVAEAFETWVLSAMDEAEEERRLDS